MPSASYSLALTVSIMVSMVAACGEINPPPSPQVSVTQLDPFNRAPKAADCHLSLLNREPIRGFTKIAIVEGWGTEEQRGDLMTAVEKKACELGADSLLVVSDNSQSSTHLVYDPAGEQPGQEGDPSISTSKGDEIIEKEHVPKIGEKGHTGYYIETYALVFPNAKK
ncbi:MAG: hypothetical protein ABSD30_09095 [Candidatus Binatus sp.]|jgi:hypothetical protein